MLAIKYQGEYFDLADGEKITVDWVSTVFNDDAEFAGSYSYPAKAPFSPKNNRLLKNAHLVENRSSRVPVQVLLVVFGRPWKKCTLTYDVTPEGYSFYLAIDNAEFAGLLKNTSLKDLFTVFEDNKFSRFKQLYFGQNIPDTLAKMAQAVSNPGDGPLVFFPYRNEGVFGEFSGTGAQGFENGIKYFNQYHGSFAPPAGAPSVRANYFYTPFFYLNWLLREVCSFLGYEAIGELFTNKKLKSVVIYNSGLLGYDQVFSDNGCQITICQHLPEFKLNEFIKALRATYKLAIYFNANDRKATFNFAPRILASPDAADISGATEPGYEIKAYTPSGYKILQQLDDSDKLFTLYEYTQSFRIGDQTEPKELSAIAGTLFSTTATEPRVGTNATWRLPWANQLGNTYTPLTEGSAAYNNTALAEPEISKNGFSFRLLNFRGMKPDSAGQLYPYASGDDLEPDGKYSDCPVSLWLGGERGMIQTFQLDWLLYYLRTEQIELSADLSAEMLEQISPLRRLTWRTPNQVLMSGLVSQLSFESSDYFATKLAAKLTVYPVYSIAAADDPLYTQLQAGPVVNPGGVVTAPVEIFVKLRTVVTSTLYRQINGFPGPVSARYVNVFLDFFSDAAGSAPLVVQDLKVKLDWHFVGTGLLKGQIDQVNTYTASGSSYRITPINSKYNNEQVYLSNTNSFYQVTYSLTINSNGDPKMPGYTVIK